MREFLELLVGAGVLGLVFYLGYKMDKDFHKNIELEEDEEYYAVQTLCTNCGTRDKLNIEIGREVETVDCPVCETDRLIPDLEGASDAKGNQA